MASSSLFPPNHFALSDKLIGVVQRIAPLYNEVDGYKRLNEDATFTVGIAKLTTKTKPQRRMKVSAPRRERCRINQAKYRERQRDLMNGLNENIQQLQEEIAQLETTRQTLLITAPTDQSVWIVATKYFELFRHGYTAPLKGSSATEPHAQLEFLKSSMALDVTSGKSVGAEALLENWRLLSLYFGDVRVQPKRMEQVSDNSLLMSTTVCVTISENTLRTVFPHLACCKAGNDEDEWAPLAVCLVNQRLELHGTVRFDWDEAQGRVVRVESKMDMLTAMMKLVGNLKNVAYVFSDAAVTPEGHCLSYK